MNQRSRRVLLTLGLATIVLSWLEVVLLRYSIPFGALLVVTTFISVVLIAMGGHAARQMRWILVVAGLGIVAQISEWILGWYATGVVAQIALLIVGFACVAVGLRADVTKGARSGPRRAARAASLLGVVVAGVVSVALVVLAITPAPVVIPLQSSLGYGNSFESAAPSEQTVLDDGTLRTTDVKYGPTYPNSFLDIYIADGDPTVVRPTYIYIHGGGWFLGSKEEGDPAAGSTDGIATIADPMLAAGYNVVFVNYALVPEVHYPTPTRQVSEAVAFLQSEGAEYGLDTSQVVLAGASAGASIVGQLSAVETNTDYARQVGIDPVMHGNLKAVVLDSAPLDLWRSVRTQTPNLLIDYVFDLAGRAYAGTSVESRDQLNLIQQADENYPVTFLSDGNTATFPDQSQDMHDRLDDLGVENALALYPVSEAILGHGYMAAPSPSTDDYNQRKVGFLGEVLGR